MIAVLYGLGAMIVAAAVLAMLLLKQLKTTYSPTVGERIDVASRPGTALLVIDVQDDFTSIGGKFGWDEAYLKGRLAAIGKAIGKAKASGIPVVAVRHVYRAPLIRLMIRLFGEGRGIPGSKGLGLAPALPFSPDAEFVKPLSDSFSSPELGRYLAENRIGTLLLTGLDGCYCIQNTANGALNRGYRVELLGEAVLSRDESGWSRHVEALERRGAILA